MSQEKEVPTFKLDDKVQTAYDKPFGSVNIKQTISNLQQEQERMEEEWPTHLNQVDKENNAGEPA